MQQSLFAMAVAEKPEATTHWETILKTAVQEATFTVFDVETTGLNPQKTDLLEITAIQYRNGEPLQKFSTLVKPLEVITPESVSRNGITNEMVQDAPPLISVLTDLCGFVGSNPILVGHNVPFDIGFIQAKLTQCNLATFHERFDITRAICTKVFGKKLMPGLPSYEGVQLAGHLGISNPNPHRAEADVMMCAEILFALTQRMPSEITTIQQLLEFHGPLK